PTSAPRNLPSFPTRRSSDLRRKAVQLDQDRIDDAVVLGFARRSAARALAEPVDLVDEDHARRLRARGGEKLLHPAHAHAEEHVGDRKSTRLNSSHVKNSYAV